MGLRFDYPPCKLEYKYDTKVSKRLSVVLRHDKGEFRLHFYNNATAEVEDILALPIMQEVRAREDTIISCVYYNSKQRFRLLWLHDPSRSGPSWCWVPCKATQKGGLRLGPRAGRPQQSPRLIHGTHYDFYKKIFKEGLLPGAGNKEWRDQLHLLARKHRLEQQTVAGQERHRAAHRPGPCQGVPIFTKVQMDITSRVNYGPQAITAVTIRETKEGSSQRREGSPPLPSIVLQALLRNQLGGRRPTANAQSSESSHRRAYMALWRLARVCCPSAPNSLSLGSRARDRS